MARLTCVVTKDADVSMIYSDKIDLSRIGEIESVDRWSTIEFNMESKCWQVRRVGVPDVLFENPLRSVCVKWEHDYFCALALTGGLK